LATNRRQVWPNCGPASIPCSISEQQLPTLPTGVHRRPPKHVRERTNRNPNLLVVQALGLRLANAPTRIPRLGNWSRRVASPLRRHRSSPLANSRRVQPRNWVLASEKRRLSEVRISEKGSRGVGRCRLPLELTSCHSFWPAMPYELANGQSFWTIANWGGVVRQFRLSQGF
jgi:hypothetical protein